MSTRYLVICFLVLVIVLGSTRVGFCQTHLDSLLTNPQFAAGDSLQQAGRYEPAIGQLETAAAYYQEAKRWPDYLYTQNKICENLWRLGQYDTAWQVVQSVRTQSDRLLGAQHSVGMYTYFNIGFLHHMYGRYEEAVTSYHTGLSLASRHPTAYPLLRDDLYHAASISYLSLGQYDSAVAYCRRGLQIRNQQGDAGQIELAKSYAQLGAIHSHLGNQDSSLWYNRQALAMQLTQTGKHHAYVATYYAHVGATYHLLDIYDSAIYYHQKALSGYRKYLGKDHYYATISQAALGDIYYDQGDYFTAQSYYQKALEATLFLFGDNHPSLLTCHSDLGNAQSRLGDNIRAAENYHKALKISQVVGDEDIQYLYNNLGDLHAEEKQFDSALWYGREALLVGEQVRGSDHLSMATLHNTLGETFHKQLMYDSALWYYQRALKVWSHHQITRHADLALLYEKLGDVHYALDDCEQALTNYQNSLTANTIDSKHQARLGFRQYISSERLLSTVGAQAQALRKRYKQTGDTSQLKQAFDTYLRYDSLIIQIQASRYRQDDQLFAQRIAKKVYEDALSTGMLLHQLTQDPAYWHRMFQLAEQSRSIALRRALASYEAKKFGGIPAEVLQREQDIKLKKAQYQTLLQKSQEANDTAQVQRCQAILLTLDQSYDSLSRTVEKDYPQYYQLKYQSKAISVTKLQKKLEENTTMLAYFLGEHTGYTFVITPQSFWVMSFVCDMTLTKQIDQLRATIAPRVDEASYQAFVAAAHGLYQKLLLPITLDSFSLSPARQLFIIPDGQLSRLPFDLLLTETSPAGIGDYQSLPYLIHQYSVSYSYSASWQFGKQTLPLVDKDPSYLAVAPAYGNANMLAYGALRSEVTPLRWNQEEVADLGTYLSGNTLIGNAATERRFKQEAAQYEVLHLATHALVNDQRSDRSGLVFAPPRDSLEDGLLQLHELYAMELPAQLAVLSACNTGGGRLEEGEGVMSLARAFAYAGCPSIVMSHWSVDDQATAQLMKYFYQYLSDGLNKAAALRKAKLSLLTSDNLPANPFYWASFVVVGDTKPLAEAPSWEGVLGYLLFSLVTVLIGVSILYCYRKK